MQEKPWDAHDYIVVEICCRAVRKSTRSRRDKLSRRRVHKAFQAGAFERVEGDGVLRLKVRAGAQNVAVWKGRNFLGTEKSGDGLVVRAQAGTCPWGKERVGGMVTAFQGYSAFFFFWRRTRSVLG